MNASFHSKSNGDVVIIDAAGRLTLGEPVESLRNAVGNAAKKVILNLEKLDYIDSAGLGELIFLNKRIDLRLVTLPKRVEDLLRLTGSYALFNIQPDEQSALASFPPRGGQ